MIYSIDGRNCRRLKDAAQKLDSTVWRLRGLFRAGLYRPIERRGWYFIPVDEFEEVRRMLEARKGFVPRGSYPERRGKYAREEKSR